MRDIRVGSESRRYRPGLECMEARQLLAIAPGPFTPGFRQSVRSLMEQANLPQISISVQRESDSYDFFMTNREYTHFNPGRIPRTTGSSLFRLASVSKVFTAVAIMKQVELGLLTLEDRPFERLGYFDSSGNGIPQSGYDPMTQGTVTYTPAPALYGITVKSLLNMSSGLPMNVPVASQTFPNAKPAQVIYVQGSYAALGFAGLPPYSSPATVQQQIAYYVYSFTTNNLSLDQPGTYAYNDTGYALLGATADRVSESAYQLDYGAFLQQYILTPMGISAPQASPAPGTPMLGIANTLRSQRYPTEVQYHTPGLPKQPNIYPNPTRKKPPFTPKAPVSQAYGGLYFVQSHFGEGGLAANPHALVRFFNRLDAIYHGTSTAGPLTQATVQAMVSYDNGTPVTVNGKPSATGSWWGLGWQVFPSSATEPKTPGNWAKNGGLPGTSTQLTQFRDGITYTFALNQRTSPKPLSKQEPGFSTALINLINAAIKAWNDPSSSSAASLVGGRRRR